MMSIGRFNETLLPSNRKGGTQISGSMKAFRECINDCCLIELSLMGKKFSWPTRGNSASRIDGAFVSVD